MWESLADRAYRSAYAVAHVGDFLAMQIHSLRKSRGWTQKQLAEKSANTQPQISKLETSCESVTLASLHKIADAFDVALIVRFAPFSELASDAIGARADRFIPSYDSESAEAIGFTNVRAVQVDGRASADRRGEGLANAYLNSWNQGASTSSSPTRVTVQ